MRIRSAAGPVERLFFVPFAHDVFLTADPARVTILVEATAVGDAKERTDASLILPNGHRLDRNCGKTKSGNNQNRRSKFAHSVPPAAKSIWSLPGFVELAGVKHARAIL